MKTLLFILLVALLATSCKKDNLTPPASGEKQTTIVIGNNTGLSVINKVELNLDASGYQLISSVPIEPETSNQFSTDNITPFSGSLNNNFNIEISCSNLISGQYIELIDTYGNRSQYKTPYSLSAKPFDYMFVINAPNMTFGTQQATITLKP